MIPSTLRFTIAKSALREGTEMRMNAWANLLYLRAQPDVSPDRLSLAEVNYATSAGYLEGVKTGLCALFEPAEIRAFEERIQKEISEAETFFD